MTDGEEDGDKDGEKSDDEEDGDKDGEKSSSEEASKKREKSSGKKGKAVQGRIARREEKERREGKTRPKRKRIEI